MKMQGYDVDIVDDGKKAFDKVNERIAAFQADPHVGVYDLILMDIQVPFHDHITITTLLQSTHVVALLYLFK
jgi:DNA-binding response OmpR family regulator